MRYVKAFYRAFFRLLKELSLLEPACDFFRISIKPPVVHERSGDGADFDVYAPRKFGELGYADQIRRLAHGEDMHGVLPRYDLIAPPESPIIKYF